MRGDPKRTRGKHFRLKLIVYVSQILTVCSIIMLDFCLLYPYHAVFHMEILMYLMSLLYFVIFYSSYVCSKNICLCVFPTFISSINDT